MAIYPYKFSSDPSLGPAKVKTKKKRSVGPMNCKTSTSKVSSAKKVSQRKKPR